MSFFVVLFCLIVERLFNTESVLKRKKVFHYYFFQTIKWIPWNWQNTAYGVLMTLFPAIIGIVALNFLGAYWSWINFLVESTILLYCLGPDNIYAQSTEYSSNIFKKAQTSLFSVLFWFVLLGPMGALLIRILERVAHTDFSSGESQFSNQMTAATQPLVGYLEWLPTRFFSGIQAIVGEFPSTLRYWLDHLLVPWWDNDQIIADMGRIAIQVKPNTLLSAEQCKSAIRLFDKTLMVFLGMVLVCHVVSVFI